ncbi:hypothetical protein DL89DRAFT_259261 [Linderina pennispora]|uniref:Uncharacterized protein n=1 Tax=Linderina pennispora TaxID=61395 RepID=A0A1Y1W3U5_9FUNG|nr:uncharacterized protein DL89DRAFT_259261 [Linderina pennispora]ORX68042.1 hypothetical protein DL89DRAFT_259261 [Linderina pennispora]
MGHLQNSTKRSTMVSCWILGLTASITWTIIRIQRAAGYCNSMQWSHCGSWNEEYIYSLEEWTRRIGSSNVFMYRTRNKVPFPPDKRFHSGSDSFKVAFGFWTEFQQEMWKYFLENDTGPCYLDAVYQPSTDGFQIWALFFERNSQPVPVSYLITTWRLNAADQRLAA